MPLDQDTRNRLQRFVTDARELLTDEFTRQLQQDYGLDPQTGTVADVASLTHLDDTRLETAQLLRDIQAHYLGAAQNGAAKKVQQDVLLRIAREQAFTVLNRLAALRMMEARGLLRESVAKDYQSEGFSLYARLAGPALGDKGDAYRCYLFSVFDEFAADLPQLFDRYSPQGRLFPRDTTLLELLGLINAPELELLWAEDETIGWIYQYFNSKEERKEMRKSAAPRNSRELAVRNQFFTPRYVVEFLVDNSLGRAWFEWTGGKTELYDRCQYLLRKPDDAAEIEEKTLRDPRGIKLLDPACGSMHFGLYAFDLFEVMYSEAWDWEKSNGPGSLICDESDPPLQEVYTDRDALLLDVPRLIIEHNIYGVDIDSRATQIASLALWLRAQRSWHDAGIKAKDRPAVGRGNVIAAVAPPAEPELRKQMAANLDTNDARLFEETLKLLKGLPELGVLLRMEKEIPHLIRTIYGGSDDLLAEQDMERWEQAENRLRDALAEFVSAAQATYQGRLFAQDALEGLRLMDLVREIFDVVVMNPPFGAPASLTKSYVFQGYSDSKYDLFSCFVSRADEMLRVGGVLGALTNRTAFALESLEPWRRRLLLTDSKLICAADLGYGVLDDAMVEAAAYVTMKGATGERLSVVSALDSTNKESRVMQLVRGAREDGHVQHEHDHATFLGLPGTPISYFVQPSLIQKLRALPEIRDAGITARTGLQTCDDFRFLRLTWEVSYKELGLSNKWVYLAKGGEYQPFISLLHLVANWENDGYEMKSYAESLYKQWSRTIQSIDYQLSAGITFSERTTSDLSLRVLPAGCLFTKTGPGFFSKSSEDIYSIIAFSYSRLFRLCCEIFFGSGDESVSGSAARHYRPSVIARFPMLAPSNDQSLSELAKRAVNRWVSLSSRNETSPFYNGPSDCLREFPYSDFIARAAMSKFDCIEGLADIQGQIESIVMATANLTDVEMSQLDEVMGQSPASYPFPDTADLAASVIELYLKSTSDLVAFAKEKQGPRRQLVKMGYVSDRKVELISHVLQVDPNYVINCLRSSQEALQFESADLSASLVSYVVGVLFGRWKRKNHEHPQGHALEADPLGELPFLGPAYISADDATDQRSAIYVDEPGHRLDIVSCLEAELENIFGYPSISADIASALSVTDLRSYLERPNKFFSYHLQQYSQSRRRAPIYWPFSTASGEYTLWIYYPNLDSQTLFSLVNDFIEPKYMSVESTLNTLRSKSNRTNAEEREFESLRDLQQELIELRDTILEIAPNYKPSQDDGVQITAAPLWPLFRHKPWRKVLKNTWEKLESGEYDWAHLAYSYWPNRVREKCKTDKSLAIAHGLDELYEESAD